MRKYPFNQKIKELAERFENAGYTLYLVGGAVRDFLLGKKNDDYDFTTDARPEEVMDLFKGHTIPTGIKHGTITVRFKGESFEITTFRTEGDYTDSRHPDNVVFVRSIESDLERRDFTINAFAANTITGEILDLNGGFEDLKAKRIKAIGNAEERFREDALRMMRACRFSAKLGFEVEEGTLNAITKLKDNIEKVSKERIKEELFKIIDAPFACQGIELMRKTGLLSLILPELNACIGMQQLGLHDKDVYTHSLLTLEAATKMDYSITVKAAALLHDIGKAVTREGNEVDGYTFYGHEVKGEMLSKQILKRLKCSNEEINAISHLIREHMFSYTPEWSDAAVRRFMLRVGAGNIKELFELRLCDIKAISGKMSFDSLEELDNRIRAEQDKANALTLKDLKINGRTLMAKGIKGPALGEMLNYLLDCVIENPSLNTEEQLLSLADNKKTLN